MSVEAISLVKAHRVGSTKAKVVLWLLADYADAEFSSFAGQKLLAAQAEIGERTVRRILKDLETRGLIRRARRYRPDGYRTSDRIWLDADAIRLLPASLAAENDSYRPNGTLLPAKWDTLTGQSLAAQYPSVEPSVEPSEDDDIENSESEPDEDTAATVAGSSLDALCMQLARERLAEFRANGGTVIRPEPWLAKVARSPAILNEALRRQGPPGSGKVAELLANTLRDIDDIDADTREFSNSEHRQEVTG